MPDSCDQVVETSSLDAVHVDKLAKNQFSGVFVNIGETTGYPCSYLNTRNRNIGHQI